MAKHAQARPMGQDGTAHRLRDALVRLALDRDMLLAEKRQTATDDKSLMRLLIREIDDTVLPRKIGLQSGEGIVATLTASNRRMIELQTAGTTILPEGEAEPNAVVQAYAQAIKALGQGSGSITLQPLGRASQSATNSSACSAASLAKVADAMGHENGLQEFFQRVKSRSTAWILRTGEGQTPQRGGASDVLQVLDMLLHITTEQRSKKGALSRLDRATPSCTAVSVSPGLQAILATDGHDALLAAISHDDMVAVMAHWQAIFSPSSRA